MSDNTTLPGTGDVIAADDVGGVKYQRVKATWGVDGTGTDVTATTPLPTSVNASIFRFSTNNTSSAELASNATFVGTIETALDQPSISLLLTSDQPITLTVFQYIDVAGTYAVPPIIYYIAANAGLSASFPLNGNYVSVSAKNTGTAATTTFELNTAYGSLPSSDGSGRMPISKADCVQLMLGTVTAAGISASMDTNGFGAVVAQISGVWAGQCYFESSNDGLAWDNILVFSRESLSLQDTLTSGGLYTIRPSGRYMRLVTTVITGTMSINAQGRAAEGIAASDLLSLAMDRANSTPLNVALMGTKQDASGALVLSDGPMFTGSSMSTAVPLILPFETFGYGSISLFCSGGVSSVNVQGSEDGLTWFSAPVAASGGNWSFSITAIATTVGGVAILSPVYFRYCRVMLTAYTSGAIVGVARLRAAPINTQSFGNIVNSQVTNSTGTAMLPNAAASADAYANPTITQIGADGMLFNGTTWDRARNNFNVNTGDTGAKTATFNGATQTNYNAAGATIVINMGTVSGTTPTLTAQVQGSADGGTTWYNIAGAVTPTINATGVTTLVVYPGVAAVANAAVSSVIPRTWRLAYTIGGTSPSFTITNVQVAYNR